MYFSALDLIFNSDGAISFAYGNYTFPKQKYIMNITCVYQTKSIVEFLLQISIFLIFFCDVQ